MKNTITQTDVNYNPYAEAYLKQTENHVFDTGEGLARIFSTKTKDGQMKVHAIRFGLDKVPYVQTWETIARRMMPLNFAKMQSDDMFNWLKLDWKEKPKSVRVGRRLRALSMKAIERIREFEASIDFEKRCGSGRQDDKLSEIAESVMWSEIVEMRNEIQKK